MDPSYNNGMNAQMPQGVSSQPMVGSGTMSQQPVISSGDGDIVLNNGSEKKSRKGIIILVILVALLLLIGGGILLWRNGVFGSESSDAGQTQAGTLEEKYNSYVNYVLYGEDNVGRPDIENISEIVAYFETLDESLLTDYLEKTNNLFADFERAYNVEIDEHGVDLMPLMTYYYDYAEKQPLQDNDLFDMYVASGEEESNKMIDSKYTITKTDGEFYDYLNAIKKYYRLYLGLIVKADMKGCIKNGMVLSGCFIISDEDEKNLEGTAEVVFDSIEKMKIMATSAMANIYVELYGELPGSDESSVKGDDAAE